METPIAIKLEQQNLIITGGNGCGKTSFLDRLSQKINVFYVQKKHSDENNSYAGLAYWKAELEKSARGTSQYQNALFQLEHVEREHEKFIDNFSISLSNTNEFCALLDEGKAIFKYFLADRKATILESTGANKISIAEKLNMAIKQHSPINLSNDFENHLVNLKTRQSFASTYDKDFKLFDSYQHWFDQLEKNIAFLMEDDSFKLIFDPDNFKFFLRQIGKADYTFQTLSSGYSSIFNIVSELIMMTEAYKIAPSELQGVVLIDEIDAHLHVSLQRKILPFLTRIYPRIQFIVSTHSPFVIGSLEDAIIYDLSSRQHFTDLSSYSYETIIEGLLGVPVMSISLEKDIMRLSSLLNEKNMDIDGIKELVEKLTPNAENLDDESAVFLLKARRVLLDLQEGN
jgi:predicted ATP-binding protein involved in virulence